MSCLQPLHALGITVVIPGGNFRNCQESSIGPNFVYFGGQKYGYRPVPAVIPNSEFEMLLRALNDLKRDPGILLEW